MDLQNKRLYYNSKTFYFYEYFRGYLVILDSLEYIALPTKKSFLLEPKTFKRTRKEQYKTIGYPRAKAINYLAALSLYIQVNLSNPCLRTQEYKVYLLLKAKEIISRSSYKEQSKYRNFKRLLYNIILIIKWYNSDS